MRVELITVDLRAAIGLRLFVRWNLELIKSACSRRSGLLTLVLQSV